MAATLAHLLELSHQALSQAQNHDWQKALDIQQQRNVLLREFFGQDSVVSEALSVQELSDSIQKMLDCDAQIKQLVEEQRAILSADYQQFQKKRQNIGEYMNHRPM
ncbi:MAG: flagellar protein FliT [Pseudomonadales bacterium]|nr:flagellar protein FliT [Pseudomonadales bacterium]